MDRLRIFRRKPRDKHNVAQKFFTGKCHICQVQNVTVGTLNCKRHNVCQLCASFVPRFMSGDFTCKICLSEEKTSNTPAKSDRYRLTDEDEQSGSNVKLSTTKITHQQDDSDLDGNNDELEKMLASYTPASHPPQPQQSKNFAPIPRKKSFLHLTIPSVIPDNESESHAGTLIYNNYVNGLIERSRDVVQNEEEPERVLSPHCFSALKDTTQQNCGSSKIRGTFRQDPTEIERGSSPCKGLRPRSVDSSISDEQLLETIGQIEGPVISSSSSQCDSPTSSSSSSPDDYDRFWDN